MKIICRHLIAIILASLVPMHAVVAAAPVVDDSENFAILDEQQADMDQPVVSDLNEENGDDEIALAHESNTNTSAAVNSLDKIHGLQQEIQELRGQLEVQAHELKKLQQQQLAFYKDLDARFRTTPNQTATNEPATDLSIGTKHNPASNNSTIPTPIEQPTPQADVSLNAATIIPATRGNPADEQLSYLAAYELVKNKRFDEALVAMQNFVKQYPQGGYTANAQYWLGELYMVKKNYTLAIEHFDIVLKQFPGSSKAAACTLKIGYALAASGKSSDAKQRLQQVLKSYPDTPTAQLAMAKLRSLNAS